MERIRRVNGFGSTTNLATYNSPVRGQNRHIPQRLTKVLFKLRRLKLFVRNTCLQKSTWRQPLKCHPSAAKRNPWRSRPGHLADHEYRNHSLSSQTALLLRRNGDLRATRKMRISYFWESSAISLQVLRNPTRLESRWGGLGALENLGVAGEWGQTISREW